MSAGSNGWPFEPPNPTGWLTVPQAAERLGKPSGYVRTRVGYGHIPSRLHRRRRWIAEATVEQILANRGRWVSYKTAARMLGVSHPTVSRLVHEGALVSRHVLYKPSLERTSVEQLATRLAAEREAKNAEQAERAAKRALEQAARERRQTPPTDGHVWFDAVTTSLVLGVTANRVRQMSVADRIPFTEQSGRRWYRRDHVEQLAAARAFAARSDRVVGDDA